MRSKKYKGIASPFEFKIAAPDGKYLLVYAHNDKEYEGMIELLMGYERKNPGCFTGYKLQ